MAIQAKCPDCGSEYNLRDDMRGKMVRCKKCTNTFTVREAGPPDDAEDLAPAKRKHDPDAIQEESRRVRDDGAAVRGSPGRRPRNVDDDDDEDVRTESRRDVAKQGKSPVMIILLIVGLAIGLPVLCCGGGYAALYYLVWRPAAKAVEEASNELNNAQANWPMAAAAAPKDLNEALNFLRENNAGKRQSAAEWLATQPLNQGREAEVADALEPLLTDANNGIRSSALKALKVWATPANVPAVNAFLIDETFSGDANAHRELAIDIAPKVKDKRMYPHVAKYLANAFFNERSKNALQAVGRDAEGEVAKYLFHPDGGARERAAFLLQQYQTNQGVILTAALGELSIRDGVRRRLALEWLEQKANLDEARRAEVARALDPLLNDGDNNVKQAALKAVGKWGNKDNGPALVRALSDVAFNPISNDMRKHAMMALAKIKYEPGIAPIAARLKDFFDRGAASAALKEMGPIAEPEVKKYLNDNDQGVRNEAKAILSFYGTKDNVGLTQAFGDLHSPDAGRRRQGADAIARMPVDAKQQKDVSLELEGVLSDNDNGVRHAALKALMVWANKESTPALVKLLEHQDVTTRHLAIQVLGKIKDDRSVLNVANRLLIAEDRRAASRALVVMGSICEEVVATALSNNDRIVRLEACKILEKVGTKKSVKTLEKAATAYTKMKDAGLAKAAQSAATAAGNRQ
jgi:predicted Zn finger-like uncharacterized protein